MGTITEKLAHTLEQKNQIKLALNTPDDVLSHYAPIISKYVKNQPKSIVEGSTAICENGIDLPCNIDINGNSYQETTEGYNLLPSAVITNETKNGITVTCDGKGKYTVKGTNGASNTSITMPLKKPVTLPTDKTLYIHIRNNVANNVGLGLPDISYEPGCGTLNRIATSEKLNSGAEITNIYIRVSSNETVDMELEPSIELTNSVTSFEKYTGGIASPNTGFPQDIEVITEASLVHRGKNRFKVLKSFSRSENGVTCELENGIITLNGEATKSTTFLVSDVNELYSLKAGTYTMSTKVLNGSYTGIVGKYVRDYTTNKEYIDGGLIDKTVTRIKTENNSNLLSVIFVSTGAVLKDYQIEIQLDEGSTATSIEPYHEPKTIPINLAGEKLAKNDNAEISVSGSVKANKVMKEYVFTGDENFTIWNSTNKAFTVTIPNLNSIAYINSVIPNAKCNYAKLNARANIYDMATLGDAISINGNYVYLLLEQIKTVDELKAWLKEKYNAGEPMKVLYETTETEVIDLPSIEPIELFEGTNVFELVTNLDTTMAVEYIVNAESLQNEITELSNAVIELGGNL